MRFWSLLISHSTLTIGYNSRPVLKVCYSQYCIILVQKQKQNKNKLYFPSSSYQTIKQTIKYFFPHKLRLQACQQNYQQSIFLMPCTCIIKKKNSKLYQKRKLNYKTSSFWCLNSITQYLKKKKIIRFQQSSPRDLNTTTSTKSLD